MIVKTSKINNEKLEIWINSQCILTHLTKHSTSKITQHIRNYKAHLKLCNSSENV